MEDEKLDRMAKARAAKKPPTYKNIHEDVKNLPDDNNSKTVEELTKKANQIIEQLEKEKNLENSLDNYQAVVVVFYRGHF